MYKKEPTYIHNQNHPKTGVLLVNLGTPEELSYLALRKYLKVFLSDTRVVELPPLLWKTLLNCVLLQIIPQKSIKNYAKIWDYEKNESPLLTITKAQSNKLQQLLVEELLPNGTMDGSLRFEEKFCDQGDHGNASVQNVHASCESEFSVKFTSKTPIVTWAMRYGPKFIEEGLAEFKQKGVETVILLPLYPQYAGATTASVYDATFDALKKMRWIPTLKIIQPYYDNPYYIAALKQSIKTALKGKEVDGILFSYHGIPQRYWKNGDPYPCHCMKTTRLVREALDLGIEKVFMSYQSQFGKDKWVEPSTESMLAKLPKEGVKNLAVITPGFSSDCIETLEEIAMAGQKTFLDNGGETFTYIPCLNDSEVGINMLRELIKRI